MNSPTTPPLLLGAALLFWGWETGFVLPALVLAVAVEASGLMPRRRELATGDFQRVWDACVLLSVIAAVFVLPADITPLVKALQLFNFNPWAPAAESVSAAYALAQWSPLLLAPIVVVQRCSTTVRLPREVFFWLLRRRPAAPGLLANGINPTFPYFALCLTAAGAANQRNIGFYAGLLLLIPWALWCVRPRRFPLPFFLLLLLAAAGAGYAGQFYLHQLQGTVESGVARMMSGTLVGRQDSAEARTGLGQVGEMKGSGAIVMRVSAPAGRPPELLRSASFDQFTSWSWFTSDRTFQPVPPTPDRNGWRLADDRDGDASVEIETRFPDQERLLALPPGAAQVEALPATAVTRNRFGAVKAGPGPRYVRYRVRHTDAGGSADSPPSPVDLQLPERERAAVNATFARLALPARATRDDKLRAVVRLFQNDFRYSTYHAADLAEETGKFTPLANFLQNTHSGHCEYFAAATALLLRRAGIPARYAIGYSVQEPDKRGNGYVVRQRHAHAWCLYFADNAWHELDTTPASWLEAETAEASFTEPLGDLWAALRFRLDAWLAAHPVSRTALPVLLTLLIGFLVWRRFAGKAAKHQARRRRTADSANAATSIRPSPFHRLETRLAELGHGRPAAEPPGPWLRRVWPQLALPAAQCEPLLRLHYRDRFDPAGLPPAAAAALDAEVSACMERLAEARRRAL